MKSFRAFTLMDLLLAVAIAVILTALLILVNRWTRESTPFREHITGTHGIDCSVNAANRRFCKELGVE